MRRRERERLRDLLRGGIKRINLLKIINIITHWHHLTDQIERKRERNREKEREKKSAKSTRTVTELSYEIELKCIEHTVKAGAA